MRYISARSVALLRMILTILLFWIMAIPFICIIILALLTGKLVKSVRIMIYKDYGIKEYFNK